MRIVVYESLYAMFLNIVVLQSKLLIGLDQCYSTQY